MGDPIYLGQGTGINEMSEVDNRDRASPKTTVQESLHFSTPDTTELHLNSTSHNEPTPNHAPDWIAAARHEEWTGNMDSARRIIKEACEKCPKSEDIWVEAIRLHDGDEKDDIIATAIQTNDQRVGIWISTVKSEPDLSDARRILARALETHPSSIELWLCLAELEEPTEAQEILRKACLVNPKSFKLWITRSKLLERQTNQEHGELEIETDLIEIQKTIDQFIQEGVDSLVTNDYPPLVREQWIKEAEKCEDDGYIRTCEAIIKAIVGLDIREQDRYDTWVADMGLAMSRGHFATARAILVVAIKAFPHSDPLWRIAMDIERGFDSYEIL